MARYSNAHKKATEKYIKNNLDTIAFRVPKGKREVYNAYAKHKGVSLTQLIISLLNTDMELNGWIPESDEQ